MINLTKYHRFVAFVLALTLGMLIIFVGSHGSEAQNASTINQIVVTSLLDNILGICPNASRCTLRAAIDAASRVPGDNTVIFNVSGTITVQTLLTINFNYPSSTLTIDGSGRTIVIDGNHKTGIFSIQGGSSTDVLLKSLTLQNSSGSAIANYGDVLKIINSSILNNESDQGGGLLNSTGFVSIDNCIFIGNSAEYGGALYNRYFGTMTISHSTIYGNSATSFGGGIFSQDVAINMLSVIVGNNTAPHGPDVYSKVVSLGHNLIGNGSDSSFLINYNATATSIAANPRLFQPNATLVAFQTQMASRTPAGYHTATPTPLPSGFTPTATSTPLPIMQNAASDQVGTAAAPIDVQLNMIATSGNNGTPVYTLPSGSPAIGHGDCTGSASVNPPAPAVTLDQQGHPRKSPCSIGAIEG